MDHPDLFHHAIHLASNCTILRPLVSPIHHMTCARKHDSPICPLFIQYTVAAAGASNGIALAQRDSKGAIAAEVCDRLLDLDRTGTGATLDLTVA